MWELEHGYAALLLPRHASCHMRKYKREEDQNLQLSLGIPNSPEKSRLAWLQKTSWPDLYN